MIIHQTVDGVYSLYFFSPGAIKISKDCFLSSQGGNNNNTLRVKHRISFK